MLYLLLKVSAIKAKKASFSGQLPVTSAGIRGRNRSTSTFSTASSASACFAFHHLNPDYENGGDGSDLPMVCQSSISQPCSHHSSFSGPSGSRYLSYHFRLLLKSTTGILITIVSRMPCKWKITIKGEALSCLDAVAQG